MCCHIDVNKPTAGMLNHHKHIEHTKGCGDHYAEVTCDDALGIITEKGGPALRLTAFARATHAVIRHVCAHSAGRDLQAEFEQQLIGDAFLSPGRVLQSHPS